MHKAASKTKSHRNGFQTMSLSFLRSQEAVPRRARLRSPAGFVFDAKDCIEAPVEYKIKSGTEKLNGRLNARGQQGLGLEI